jgi:uncharacterized protein
MVKYRTIEEAQQIEVPKVPLHLIEEFIAFAKTLPDATEKNSGETLRQIYALTDKLTALVSPCAVCEKGCTHCCKIDVHVWPAEAEYIQKFLSIGPQTNPAVLSGHADKQKRCPFLDDAQGICTIYAFRPFKCRTAFTLDDPAFCATPDAVHVIYTSNSNLMLNELLNMIVKINEEQPVRDIRDFFNPHSNTPLAGI